MSIRYFVFTFLPFGLSSAPYIFANCLKPLEKYWRFNRVNIALFLDDGWTVSPVRSELLIAEKENMVTHRCEKIWFCSLDVMNVHTYVRPFVRPPTPPCMPM